MNTFSHHPRKAGRPRWLAVVLTIALALSAQQALAAALTTPRDYLNRQKAAQTTGIQHEVFFTAATNVSGGAGANKVTLTFPDSDNWCSASASVTVAGITDPTGASESATALPGTLTGACATGANDTITVTGVDDLTATTKYGFRVTGSGATLGSPAAANNVKVTITTNNGTSDIDTGTYALSFITDDQVVVTATVDPTLTVVLNSNAASLGTLSATANSYVGVTSTTTTNAKTGYISLVKYGATLTSGSNTIPDVGGTPADNMTAGTSAYGVSTSDTGVDITQYDTDSNNCDGTTRTTGNAVSADALTTTFQSFASNTVAVSAEATTLCFLATITGTQAPGTYTSTSTLVTTAKF